MYKTSDQILAEMNMTVNNDWDSLWKDPFVKKMERQFNRQQRKENNINKYGNSLGIKNSTLNSLEGIGGAFGAFNTASESPLTAATNKAISLGLNTTPVGKIVDFVRQGLNTVLKATDLNIDEIDKDVVRRQNLSQAANFGNQIMAGFGFIPALGKVDKAKILDSKVSSSLSGVTQDADDMQELSNKGLFFGLKSANKRMRDVNTMINKANEIAWDAKRKENNYMPQFLTTNYAMDYQGYKPGLSLQKNGGCIPELENARSIILSIKSKKQSEPLEIAQKFQLGGKMNMIVTGALHARKHNLEELNPKLEGEITKKGIPVVVMNEGGEVQGQQAEVESQELVLQIDATKTIEDYYDEYNSTDSKTEKNKIALECGKYLVDELLKNTDDPDKLIKKTV